MNRVLSGALIACLVACSSMAKQSEAEKARPEKVRVERHKLKADVKKLKPVKGKEQMEEVTETREFPLMFDITEKAQKHKAKRLEKEAEKAAKEAEKAAKKGKG